LSRGPAFSESLAFRAPRGKHGYSSSSEWIESGARRRDSLSERKRERERERERDREKERERTRGARDKRRNAFWRFEECAGERENSIRRRMKLGAESEKKLRWKMYIVTRRSGMQAYRIMSRRRMPREGLAQNLKETCMRRNVATRIACSFIRSGTRKEMRATIFLLHLLRRT